MNSRICLSSFDRRVLVILCAVCCVTLGEFMFALLVVVEIIVFVLIFQIHVTFLIVFDIFRIQVVQFSYIH